MLEGSLPECLKLAVFDGRRSAFHDTDKCDHRKIRPQRYGVNVGRISRWGPMDEGGPDLPWGDPNALEMDCVTDDPDEAERLWAEAQERLRA